MRRRVPGRLVDVGGFRLHIDGVGEGRPTVVFDAALAGSSISWTFVQPHVAEFARACTYDRAGFGWSDGGPLPRARAGRIADELRLLLTQSGEPGPYLLVGHSFGGLVMRIFAGRWPELTAGLVLVDPAHPEDWVRPAPKEQARIDRGVRLSRQGLVCARLGLAHVVSGLVGIGAWSAAKWLVDRVSRGGLMGDADWILAPMWKLPPAAQRRLRSFWTRPRFFEALGSQIAHISDSARETLEASPSGYGDLPLVTISSTDPGDYRIGQQTRLAATSTRGRHLVAARSGHWVPLDEPALVVSVIRAMCAAQAA